MRFATRRGAARGGARGGRACRSAEAGPMLDRTDAPSRAGVWERVGEGRGKGEGGERGEQGERWGRKEGEEGDEGPDQELKGREGGGVAGWVERIAEGTRRKPW